MLSLAYEVLFSLTVFPVYKRLPVYLCYTNEQIMKKSFRYIVTSVLALLLIVFSWQVFWLHGLYTSMHDELKREISTCLESAELLELFYRMQVLEQEHEEKNFEQMISISAKPDDQGNINFEKEDRFVDRSNEKNDTTITKTSLKEIEESFFADNFVRTINTSMHEAIDKEIPINLHMVDSLFRDNIRQKNIYSVHYYSEVFDTEQNQVINTTQNDETPKKLSASPTLTYFFDADNNYCFRIYMEPLTSTILLRMGGILVTTLLIIIILAFAFWYLIRTVLNQKTLEEMKDDFTNNMTHELKTPIAVAYSATDALLNFNLSKNEEKRKKYLQISKEQLIRLSNLVEQILSMSMEQRKSFVLHREDIQLKELIDKLVEQHKLKAGKPVNFTINYATDKLTLHADRTHLTNMLSNLIDNAIKYSGEETQITIGVDEHNDIYHFSITDNGQGIPADKQAHIFDKFYRVPHGNLHNVKGYGLGLFYVKVMAEKHGGSVSVKSAPGKGATFTIQIPANKDSL